MGLAAAPPFPECFWRPVHALCKEAAEIHRIVETKRMRYLID
jgi:hypothetical protein